MAVFENSQQISSRSTSLNPRRPGRPRSPHLHRRRAARRQAASLGTPWHALATPAHQSGSDTTGADQHASPDVGLLVGALAPTSAHLAFAQRSAVAPLALLACSVSTPGSSLFTSAHALVTLQNLDPPSKTRRSQDFPGPKHRNLPQKACTPSILTPFPRRGLAHTSCLIRA
jgi:hypothetical protein